MDEKKKQSNDKKKLLLVLGSLIIVAILIGVIAFVKSKENNDTPVTKPPGSNVGTQKEEDILSAYDLLNDSLIKGYIGDGINQCSYPKDSVWKRLQASKIPLKVGESYTETFDREYFDTRLRVQTGGNGVTAELSSKEHLRAGTGNSLIIDSQIGMYTGVYLKGMRFAANGVYQIEFDYRILKESDDFFFQFRADSDGKTGVRTGDKFVTIRGTTGAEGTVRWVAELDNFQDYGIMIFPRNKAGKIAIDNIKITRLDKDYNVLAVGNTVKEDFDGTMFFEFDKELVPNSGFVTGDKAIDGRSLYIESDKEFQPLYLTGFDFHADETYRIKFDYVINDPTSNFYCQMISKSGQFKQFYSFGDGTVAIGEKRTFDHIFEIGGNEKEYLIMLFPGLGNEKSGITIDNIEVTRMSTEWSVFKAKTPTKEKAVVENFEKGLYNGQLLVSQLNTGSYKIVKGDSSALQITMPDKFSGVEFVEGLKLTKGAKYKVSFDYEVVKNPGLGAFYVQFTGGVDYGELIDLTKGKTGSYEGTITAGDTNAETVVLQMFGNQPDMVMNIDNLKIIVADEESIPKDIELNVGDKYVNDFDDNNRLVLDTGSVPNTKVESNDNTIDGNSLIFNSDGEYKCVYINGITLDGKGIYRIRFDYKVMERQDIFYFQFVSKSGAYTNFMSFGDGTVPLNSTRTFDQIFVLNTEEEVLMQIFPGATKGNNSVIIDDFTIERLDPDSPVFEQKTVTEDSEVTENFENGLYGGSITPNQQGTGTFSIVDGFDGKGLEITVPDAFAGVQFKNGVKFESGEKYSVSFDYKVTENPNNAAFYVQIGGVDYEEVSVPAGTTGNVKTTLTAGSANGNPEVLQIFANQPGLKMLIDNLRIEVAEEIPVHKDIELNVGEKYTNDFDENNDLILDTSNVPNSSVESNSDTIDDNSFILNSDGEYKGVYIKGITLDSKGIYRVSFDYKVNERQDLFYFQFISQSGTYTNAMSFGGGTVPLGSTRTFDQIFVLDADEEMLMQMFPGSTKGNNSVIIDNFTIERLDPESSVFEQKAVTEDSTVTETFENGLYGGSITPNQQGTGTFSIVDGFDGKGLEITVPDAFSGVQFKNGVKFETGERYNIFFDYKITENPNNAAFYVQIGGVDYKEVSVPAGTSGSVKTTLTVGGANGNPEVLQLFANQAGLIMLIDNIRIEKFVQPSTPLDEKFDEVPYYNWTPNSSGDIVSLTSDTGKLPSNGAENSLYVNCQNQYGGVVMTPLYEALQSGQKYDISFDIKALNVPEGVVLYIQSGGGNFIAVPIISGMDEKVEVTLAPQTEFIQLFASIAGLEFTIDNWSMKLHVTTEVYEDFEDFNALGITLIPTDAEFSESNNVPAEGSGNSLYMKSLAQYGKLTVERKGAFVVGEKYIIKMKYKTIANPNNSILYIQFPYSGINQVLDPNINPEGTCEVQLVAESTDSIWLMSSAAGLELVIDDLSIERVTSGVFFANFDTANNFIVNPNNDATISSCFNPNLRPNGATNNSLMVTSQSAYGGVILVPQNFTMEAGKDYRLSFRYKIIENLSAGPLYIKLGNGGGEAQLNSEAGHSELVNITLKAAENLIQIFGGPVSGIKFTIDDFVIEPKN